jgi:hypothetical protein
MKITKNRYLEGFGIIVILLALVRCVYPSVAEDHNEKLLKTALSNSTNVSEKVDSVVMSKEASEAVDADDSMSMKFSPFFDKSGKPIKNRIYSVPNFGKAFPDQNDVQLAVAMKYGVQPVQNRGEAENRKRELVFIGCNPYFYVDHLHNSIPYLVPRASVLLQEIGRTFFDSLQMKGVPLHKIIITSVMRTKDDVAKLRDHNGNATQNSCHLYGTTFDLCYNRYKTVEDPDGPKRRQVRNDTLKWVLSEVLNDMRKQNRCFIKYEVHQGCFHITVK